MAPSSAFCTLAEAVFIILFLGSPVTARSYVNSDKTLEQAMREDVDLSQVCIMRVLPVKEQTAKKIFIFVVKNC